MAQEAKQLPAKPCEICGARMQRKRFNGRLEDAGIFTRRRFCSLSCANSREKGGTSATTYHRRAGRARRVVCEICAKTHHRLHVHHIDRDPANNATANLQTLCPSCHKLLHVQLTRRG